MKSYSASLQSGDNNIQLNTVPIYRVLLHGNLELAKKLMSHKNFTIDKKKLSIIKFHLEINKARVIDRYNELNDDDDDMNNENMNNENMNNQQNEMIDQQDEMIDQRDEMIDQQDEMNNMNDQNDENTVNPLINPLAEYVVGRRSKIIKQKLDLESYTNTYNEIVKLLNDMIEKKN
jgi:ribosomal protein S4